MENLEEWGGEKSEKVVEWVVVANGEDGVWALSGWKSSRGLLCREEQQEEDIVCVGTQNRYTNIKHTHSRLYVLI